MRIVIDLQGVQSEVSRTSMGSYCLSLVQTIVGNKGEHEVFIALSDSFPDTIEFIRTSFDGILPQENIRIWYTPKAAKKNKVEWEIRVERLLCDAFLTNLKPDWLILPMLFELTDNSIISNMAAYTTKLQTAVIIHQLPELDQAIEKKAVSFAKNKLKILQQAQLCLTAVDLPVHQQESYLGIEKNKIKKLQFAPDNKKKEQLKTNIEQLFQHLTENQIKNNSLTPPVTEHKLKLAYVSPLPPLRTGIADYSSELLPELARYYDIDVIVEQDEVTDEWVIKNCNIGDTQWLIEHAVDYERVIYHLGNSSFHLYMIDLLRRIPGIVVLHDFYLGGAYYVKETTELSNVFNQELYNQRGYIALKDRYERKDDAQIILENPCNLSIIQDAMGLILHSNFSNGLLVRYGMTSSAISREVIPLLRSPPDNIDKNQARVSLGIKDHEFIICSFGVLDKSKQNQRLLDAWLSSSLAKNKDCKLVFVGQNSQNAYGEQILQIIKKNRVKNQVLITGWTETEDFRLYLAIADIAVQLRTTSRGETSAAVLDAMNHGLATIVNANGAMAELNSDAVYLLDDDFSDADLVQALETLWENKEKRQQLSAKAKGIISTEHQPEYCAKKYIDFIEAVYQKPGMEVHRIIKKLASFGTLPKGDDSLQEIAACIDKNVQTIRPLRSLFVDVSATCRNDLKTGIERVSRAILMQLINNSPKGYKVEPVYLSEYGGIWHYRYARNYTLEMIQCPVNILNDEIIEARAGDLMFAADLSGGMIVSAEKEGVYDELKKIGVSIVFTVFDLLPELSPDMFPPGANIHYGEWLDSVCRISDKVMCISKSVANDLKKRLDSSQLEIQRQQPLQINWFHLGADINMTAPSKGMPEKAEKILNIMRKKYTFLIVGTIEPRKGLLQVVDAFEQLWRDNNEINLVIVGKEGWQGLPNAQRGTIPEIINKLRRHSEWNKRLFWLEGISDEYLEKVYAASTCLIAASEGEGFGLPLIEAAQHKLPIIARDIPVFREVAGEHAFFFDGKEPKALATAIQQWLILYKTKQHPQSNKMPWLTWQQSSERLLEIILGTEERVSEK